jgi:hypothetical protein
VGYASGGDVGVGSGGELEATELMWGYKRHKYACSRSHEVATGNGAGGAGAKK